MSNYSKQIYYLISQDYYDNELMDVLYKENVFSSIKDTEITMIDIKNIDNLFEVIQEDNNYKIIYIHKHQKIHGKFKVGDKIYLDNGMISFYTKNINGDINELCIFPSKIIKKELITIINSFEK